MDRVKVARELVRAAKRLVAGPYKVGDLVKFVRGRRVYKVIREDQFGHYDLEATTGGVRGSRPSGVDPHDLLPAGGDIGTGDVVDKQGQTAAEAAKRLGRWVVVDMHRLIREQLGEVLKITPKGQVLVQTYLGGKYSDQETFEPDKRRKGDKLKFVPQMYRGEWRWEARHFYIKEPYKGGSLSSLLD